ncbi:DDB1- and CUL4-associated factor 8 isoform X1 [Copidosoma floridanum]|uniref:DDB1- and CUL4-associated factor 8 isoform X1 n=1 Tax=Copidosoma floridanum TaxID=29053 RepID=UPI0006C9B70B|nr:DDB1- and CUL4-associated factor 8 isoform X1 [Copidosoma floridanum]
MEGLAEKVEHCDNQEKIVNYDDVHMEEDTLTENTSNEAISINGSSKNENQDDEESKTADEVLKKKINGEPNSILDDDKSVSTATETSSNCDDNTAKSVEKEVLVNDQISPTKKKKLNTKEDAMSESNSKDELGYKNDLNKSDSDDLNKDNTEKDESTSQSEPRNPSSFKKVESKIRKRNYRRQQNSSDVNDQISDHEELNEKKDENSESSSDSIESDERRTEDNSDSRRRAADSSDSSSDSDRGNDDADSIIYTSASDDDHDHEMPAVLQKEPLKSDYSILKDIINRQIGSNKFLAQRYYSSLHVVQRFELMSKLKEHTGCVNSLDFNNKGNLLASGSDDLTIAIWDWALGKKSLSLESGHRSNVFQSKWLPLDVENFLVSSARDGQVRLMDITSKITRRLAQHRKACHKISTHKDLPHIVLSAAEDSKVLSIDVREGKPTKLLSVCEDNLEVELYSIHSNPLNNCEFCIAGRMRNTLVYDKRKLAEPLYQLCPKHLLSDNNVHLTCAVYNYNGTEIVGSYNNEDVYLFDVSSSYQSGDFAHKYQGHRNSATVKGVNFFGPKSEFILSGSDCGNIFIWDKKTEAIVQWMPGDEHGSVNVLESHPHIPILATSGLDYDVKIWIPSRESTPNIKQKLQSCVKKNLATREANSAFDGNILWIMLRRLHQQRPRAFLNRNVSRNGDTSDEYSNSDEGNEDDHDDENDASSDD